MSTPKVRWVSCESACKNISGDFDIYSATDTSPQNPGWVKFIEAAPVLELMERMGTLFIAFANKKGTADEVEAHELRKEFEAFKKEIGE